MRRLLALLGLLLVCSCASAPTPVPSAPPTTPPPPPRTEERATKTVYVTASALNVRREPNADAEVLTQLKRGTELAALRSDDSWVQVRLSDGTSGWVAARFVDEQRPSSSPSRSAVRRPATGRGGCQPNSDYAFVKTPTPTFSDSGAHGLVVVDANVNARGEVTSTKVISNNTGDSALAFLAEREIKSAKFSPPIRDCGPRAFIFTYRRTF